MLSVRAQRALHVGFAVVGLAAILMAGLVVLLELSSPAAWLWTCLGVALCALAAEVVLLLLGRRPAPAEKDAHEFEI